MCSVKESELPSFMCVVELCSSLDVTTSARVSQMVKRRLRGTGIVPTVFKRLILVSLTAHRLSRVFIDHRMAMLTARHTSGHDLTSSSRVLYTGQLSAQVLCLSALKALYLHRRAKTKTVRKKGDENVYYPERIVGSVSFGMSS